MTTLERAKRFHKAIQRRWLEILDVPVGTGYATKVDLLRRLLGREIRAVRALIEHEARSHEACIDLNNDLIADGLRRAIQILDAVYGREEK